MLMVVWNDAADEVLEPHHQEKGKQQSAESKDVNLEQKKYRITRRWAKKFAALVMDYDQTIITSHEYEYWPQDPSDLRRDRKLKRPSDPLSTMKIRTAMELPSTVLTEKLFTNGRVYYPKPLMEESFMAIHRLTCCSVMFSRLISLLKASISFLYQQPQSPILMKALLMLSLSAVVARLVLLSFGDHLMSFLLLLLLTCYIFSLADVERPFLLFLEAKPSGGLSQLMVYDLATKTLKKLDIYDRPRIMSGIYVAGESLQRHCTS